MRSANPSTTAVFPTPASPVRIGLFWRRRMRMSDHLSNLAVAAQYRIDFSSPGVLCYVDR